MAKTTKIAGSHTELIRTLRRLHAGWVAALELEWSLEPKPPKSGSPRYQRAAAATRAAEKRLDAMRETIRRRPVTSWADAVLLAELVKSFGFEDDDPHSVDGTDAALHALYEAVLGLGEKTGSVAEQPRRASVSKAPPQMRPDRKFGLRASQG